jgi:hypothetical protein
MVIGFQPFEFRTFRTLLTIECSLSSVYIEQLAKYEMIRFGNGEQMNGRFWKLMAAAALGTVAMFGNTVSMSFGANPFPQGEIGPYTATINGVNAFVYCDDDTHLVYPNETWTATVTTLKDLVALGSANIASQSTVMWRALPNALTLYEQAGWLVNQFGSHPADASGIQNAIWDIFLQRSGTGLNTDQKTDAYWLVQAINNYNSVTAVQLANTVFLTPVAGSQVPFADGTPQEFITLTPEPASYALLGLGLMLVSLGTFRRRHRQGK